MARKQTIPAKKRAVRSDNNRQQKIIRARCLEINPDYNNLSWIDRMDIFSKVRNDMGLPYVDIMTGEIRPGKGE